MNSTNQVVRVEVSKSEEIVFLPFEKKDIPDKHIYLVKNYSTLKEVA
jgi:hypothetical protein